MVEDMDSNTPLIASQLTDALRLHSAKAEELGRLTDEQLAIIYDQKWFKLFVPKCFGGLELTLPDGVRLEEELARMDGSLGWTVTLCSGANLFVGYIDPRMVSTIFSRADVCLGGSGQAAGTALVDRGGYIVNGHWHYATGAPHLTHFTVNCVMEQSGKSVLDNQGNPRIQSFFFAKDDVELITDWNTFGLKATASHSFRVTNLRAEESHTFLIAPQHAQLDHPIYQYPFLQFAEATLAANTLGMARHFIACAEALFTAKQPDKHDLLEVAKRRIREARLRFYDVLEASWAELLTANALSGKTLAAVSERSKVLVQLSREQVVLLYPHCGITAADASSEINRIWRDLFTASQHSLLR